MSFLLDTNVISEVRKGANGNKSVVDWYRQTDDRLMFLSSMVIGEIRKGIERLAPTNSEAAVRIDEWLTRVCRHYEYRIIPVDVEVAEEWGRMSAADPPPVVDGLIAATAKVHGLTLVTRNVTDVERTGVRCLDPFLPN